MGGQEIKTLSCLYTSQKMKKRKRWEDGILQINEASGFCSLFPVQNGGRLVAVVPLDSQCFPLSIIGRVMCNDIKEIEMEGYMITINEENSTAVSAPTSMPTSRGVLKVAKFKIPKIPGAIPKPLMTTSFQSLVTESTSSDSSSSSSSSSSCFRPIVSPRATTSFSFGARGKYDVEEDELDEIWGRGLIPEPSVLSRVREVVNAALPAVESPTIRLRQSARLEMESNMNDYNRSSVPLSASSLLSRRRLYGNGDDEEATDDDEGDDAEEKLAAKEVTSSALKKSLPTVFGNDNIWGKPLFSIEDE